MFLRFSVVHIRLCLFTAVVLRCCAAAAASADVSWTITAYVNETTSLPCNITVVGEPPTVEWSKEGLVPKNITFLYRRGCETFEEKNPEFDYRTNLFLNKLEDGNLSQIIHSLRLSDAGRYQCRTLRGKQWTVESTVDLIVVAASEPKLTVFLSGDEVWLQCKAECWSSEPTVQFLDDQGNELDAQSPKRDMVQPRCFTVTRKVALQPASNRVKCRVSQMNVTKETEIFIPDNWRGFCIKIVVIGVSITVLLTCLCLCLCGFCCYKYRHIVCRQKPLPSELLPRQDEEIIELKRQNKELKESLSEKDQCIQNLERKSKNTPAPKGDQGRKSKNLKGGHSMCGSRSTLNGSCSSIQLSQSNNQNPATPSTSHHPELDNKSVVKESKPAAPKQSPTPIPQKKPDRPKSISALYTNDDAAFKGSKLQRSSSVSASRSNMATSQRRYTMPNRYSLLEYLNEDPESQSLIES